MDISESRKYPVCNARCIDKYKKSTTKMMMMLHTYVSPSQDEVGPLSRVNIVGLPKYIKLVNVSTWGASHPDLDAHYHARGSTFPHRRSMSHCLLLHPDSAMLAYRTQQAI